MSSPADSNEPAGFVSKRSVRLQRSFPMVAVVGMDNIKQALLLGACDTGVLFLNLILCSCFQVYMVAYCPLHVSELLSSAYKAQNMQHPLARTAAYLTAGLGGVCIAGKRGTCKVRLAHTRPLALYGVACTAEAWLVCWLRLGLLFYGTYLCRGRQPLIILCEVIKCVPCYCRTQTLQHWPARLLRCTTCSGSSPSCSKKL